MYIGFVDGSLKTVLMSKDAPTPPEVCRMQVLLFSSFKKYTTQSLEAGKKMHQASICCLDFKEPNLYCGASDGSITVWGTLTTVSATRERPKKPHKHTIVKFFPDKEISIVATPERVSVFQGSDFDDDKAGSFIGLSTPVKAVTGFSTEYGARAFVGMFKGEKCV